MKSKILFLTLVLFLLLSFIGTKAVQSDPRNVLLEFETGTWCGYCPCGDAAAENILASYPNTLVIAYHVGDVFSYFNGSEIRGLLGFNGVPEAVIDRGNFPATYPSWYNLAYSEYYNNPNTVINVSLISKDYNSGTRTLTATITSTALDTLTDQYFINYVITEGNIVYPQNFYASCGSPGYHNDYVHYWLCRNMVNGALGDTLNFGTWNANQTITTTLNTTIDNAWVDTNCTLLVFVYKYASPMYMATIEQGIQDSVVSQPVGIRNNHQIVREYSLSQNYPNPFNPTTNIKFSVAKDGNVSLKIYDVTGAVVQTYLDGFVKAGTYNADIDGSNLASGVYFYTLRAADFMQTKKMILVK